MKYRQNKHHPEAGTKSEAATYWVKYYGDALDSQEISILVGCTTGLVDYVKAERVSAGLPLDDAAARRAFGRTFKRLAHALTFVEAQITAQRKIAADA